MLAAAIEHLNRADTGLERVVFCLFGARAYGVFEQELRRQMGEAA